MACPAAHVRATPDYEPQDHLPQPTGAAVSAKGEGPPSAAGTGRLQGQGLGVVGSMGGAKIPFGSSILLGASQAISALPTRSREIVQRYPLLYLNEPTGVFLLGADDAGGKRSECSHVNMTCAT